VPAVENRERNDFWILRMEALQRKNEGLMHSVTHSAGWIAVAIVIVITGCKVGNPMDRTVQITQEPTLDPTEVPSPRTRLAGNTFDRSTEPNALTSPAKDSPHESPTTRNRVVKPAVARKAPASPTGNQATSDPDTERSGIRQVSNESPVEVSMKSVPDEYANVLEAFRDSSPEVQQQAIRQLIAVSGRHAPTTDSPHGIADAVRSSMSQLPILPEYVPEAETLPLRLAAGGTASPEPGPVAKAVAEDVGDAKLPTVRQAKSTVNLTGNKVALNEIHKIANDAISNAPLPTGSGGDLSSATPQEIYQELSGRLAKPIAGESDADRYRRQIIARHLMLFSGNPDGAVEAFDGMTENEQEFLRHFLLGVWSMVDTSGHPVAARRWAAALPELRLATQKLSSATESLDLHALAFCSEIQSFGQVTKFVTNRFTAGQKVILYCEIDNFLAQSTSDGFETHLQGSYEVFDSKGQKVAGQVLPADKQVCANYLRDYFIAYQMSLPAGLAPGEYRLELTMECLKGQKYGQLSLPLQIVTGPGK